MIVVSSGFGLSGTAGPMSASVSATVFTGSLVTDTQPARAVATATNAPNLAAAEMTNETRDNDCNPRWVGGCRAMFAPTAAYPAKMR